MRSTTSSGPDRRRHNCPRRCAPPRRRPTRERRRGTPGAGRGCGGMGDSVVVSSRVPRCGDTSASLSHPDASRPRLAPGGHVALQPVARRSGRTIRPLVACPGGHRGGRCPRATRPRCTHCRDLSRPRCHRPVDGRPGLRSLPTAADSQSARRLMQRVALALLFAVIAASLALVAAWSALEGGRAWVVALTAGALALWMGDLARRAWPR